MRAVPDAVVNVNVNFGNFCFEPSSRPLMCQTFNKLFGPPVPHSVLRTRSHIPHLTAGTPLFPFSPPRLKSLPLPNTIPERTKTHFLKCLELAQSFNSKKNTDLWGYTYTALTKLDW